MVSYVDIRQPKGGSSRSLKRHLALGLGFFTLLLSAGLSFFVEHLAAQSSVRQIGYQLAERATRTRDRLDVGVYERLRDARLLAALGAGDGTLNRQQLEEVQQGRPVFVWVGFADLSGRVVAAAQGKLEGENLSMRPWFRRALQETVIEDLLNDELWPKLADQSAAQPSRFLVIAVPVRNSAGRTTGALVIYLDWEKFRDLRPAVEADTTLFVLSRSDIVLHGLVALEGRELKLHSAVQATQARAVWLQERWPDGDSYITAASITRGYLDFPGLGWKVVLRQDPGEALAEVGRMQLQIITSGLILGVIFACGAWWFAGRVARPLAAISASADRLGAGERDVTIPAVTGYSEVEHLGASLRAMLSSLRRQEEDLVQARDKLELRVRERAAELTRTRADLEATMAERERAQRDLAREKERLDLALDAAEVAIWTYDLASGRIELSEQWAALLGGARGVTVASVNDVIALVPEAERGAVKDAMAAAASGIKDSYVVRHHVKRANGELVLTESRGRVVERDGRGLAVRLAGTVRAI